MTAEMVDDVVAAKKRRKKALIKVGFSVVALTAVILALRAKRVQIAEGFSAVTVANWIAVFLPFLVIHFFSALKWRLYLKLCGAEFGTRETLRCYGAGLFANLCMPSMIGGDLLRAMLAMKHARSKAGVVLAALLDRLSDAMSLAILTLIGAITCPPVAGATASPVQRALLALGLGVIGIAAAAIGVTILFKKKPLRRWPRKKANKILGLLRALRTVRRTPGIAVVGVFSGCAIQGGLLLLNERLGRALGLDLPLSVWFLAWPVAKLAAMMPISFAGIGVREGAFAAVLKPFTEKGGLAVSVSLVWQTILIGGGFVGGIFWRWGGKRGNGVVENRPATGGVK